MTQIKIDKFDFLPDTSFRTHFPWEQVISCLYNRLDSKDFKGHDNCPQCGCSSEELAWIDFVTPTETWEHLAGRKGPLSICPKCKIQVEFEMRLMN